MAKNGIAMITICFNNVYTLNVVMVVLKKLETEENVCILMIKLTN